ncbi:hypothetical protein K439DRAFT_1624448 [Ramaria rubella]|nr:hypothetical protein K439DRAFT_1624448 [Ramaria rubella]
MAGIAPQHAPPPRSSSAQPYPQFQGQTGLRTAVAAGTRQLAVLATGLRATSAAAAADVPRLAAPDIAPAEQAPRAHGAPPHHCPARTMPFIRDVLPTLAHLASDAAHHLLALLAAPAPALPTALPPRHR